ncbi:MAG: bifunctional nuclease family protein [Chloroflexota bacterium]|nr:bifunctional nuclease family protein [Chloroflexota bacterium]
MIEMKIVTIQVSLVSAHRIVLLKEVGGEHYLPIWIGSCEAEAISIHLRGMALPRPMTHDLFINLLASLELELSYVLVRSLLEGTFYGRLVVRSGHAAPLEIDSRPSDALAIAVRANAPIYATESVMSEAGITPSVDLLRSRSTTGLDAFHDFFDNLDMDKLATD